MNAVFCLARAAALVARALVLASHQDLNARAEALIKAGEALEALQQGVNLLEEALGVTAGPLLGPADELLAEQDHWAQVEVTAWAVDTRRRRERETSAEYRRQRTERSWKRQRPHQWRPR